MGDTVELHDGQGRGREDGRGEDDRKKNWRKKKKKTYFFKYRDIAIKPKKDKQRIHLNVQYGDSSEIP